jgi:transcriptional regulator with XRE-family HTH domain
MKSRKKPETLDIARFCKRMGYTYADLSKLIGMTQSLIGQAAAGRTKLSYENLLKLIQLGATAEELFGDEIGGAFKMRCYGEYAKDNSLFNASDPKSVVMEGLKAILSDMQKHKHRKLEIGLKNT